MLEERVASSSAAHTYAFMLSACGLFYGYGIGLFNNFFEHFILTFGITDLGEQNAIQGKFNMTFVIGGTIACVLSTPIYETMGRYRTMLLLFLLQLVVCLGMLSHSLQVYYWLRALSGFVGCFWTFLAPIMMKENLPPSLDARFNPFFTGMISLGVIYGFSFCTPWSGRHWRFVVASPLLTELPKLAFFLWQRMESPAWLVSRGATVEQLRENYRYLYEEEVADELAREMKRRAEGAQMSVSVPFRGLFAREYRLQFFLVMLMNLLNQLTGGGLLEQYSSNIFRDAGLASPSTLTILLGVMSFFAGVFVFFAAPRFGTRNLLIAGLTGQSAGYSAFIIGHARGSATAIVGGIFLSYFAYCISLGGVLFSYNVDIFPSKGIAFCAFFQWVVSCFLSRYGISLMNLLKSVRLLFIMQLFATIGAVIYLGFSIDTNNKSEEEIKREFQTKRFFS